MSMDSAVLARVISYRLVGGRIYRSSFPGHADYIRLIWVSILVGRIVEGRITFFFFFVSRALSLSLSWRAGFGSLFARLACESVCRLLAISQLCQPTSSVNVS